MSRKDTAGLHGPSHLSQTATSRRVVELFHIPFSKNEPKYKNLYSYVFFSTPLGGEGWLSGGLAGWVVALVPRPVDGELLAQARGAAKRSQRRAAAA